MNYTKEKMREYQRARRKRLSNGEDKRQTNRFVDWGNSWYKSALLKNSIALRRMEDYEKFAMFNW